MNESEIKTVQQQVRMIRENNKEIEAGIAFYTRLFAENPDIVRLFLKVVKHPKPYDGTNPGLVEQARKITAGMFGMILALNTEEIEEMYTKQAKLHKMRGITREHFTIVGKCFVATLKDAFGDAIDASAWTSAYYHLGNEIVNRYPPSKTQNTT